MWVSFGSAKPVIMQSSLKGWNRKWMWVKGLDVEYIPLFANKKKEIEENETYKFEGEAFRQIHAFCECLDFQMTRDTFMKHDQMYELGCKYTIHCSQFFILLLEKILSFLLFSGLPYYDPGLTENVKKNDATRLLAAQLNKLIGVHQVKVPSNRAPSTSETGTGVGSSVRSEGGGETQNLGRAENQTLIDVVESPRSYVHPSKR